MPEDFKITRFTVSVPPKNVSITAEAYEPAHARAILTLAHGAGTDMDHPFLKDVAMGLANAGICVVRFNFVYTELRKKMPDRLPVASAVVKSVVEESHRRFQSLPLFCGGKSFGGRMSSMTLAESCPPYVKGVIFYGFPLHPPGDPSVERAEHLKKLKIPLLFLQGTKDALANLELITSVTRTLHTAELVTFEGADHSFKKGKQTSIPQLIEHSIQWVNKHA